MAGKAETVGKDTAPEALDDPPSCFVMMAISDQDGYPAGHFKEVYESIIVPAVEACGYAPIRADQVSTTNLIHLDILRRILEAPMTICDLSAANPNVMFELGIRQAFDKPVVLLKDTQTRKIFDIDTMRTIPYDAALRPRAVLSAIADLTRAITATRDAKPEDGLNSIVGLLGLHAAALKGQDEDPASAKVAIFDTALQEIKYSINRMSIQIANLSAANEWRSAPPAPTGLSALGQSHAASDLNRSALEDALARNEAGLGLLGSQVRVSADGSVHLAARSGPKKSQR